MPPQEAGPDDDAEKRGTQPCGCCATRTCWSGSWPTSTWWARRPTSWSATWPPSVASSTSRLAIIIQSSSAAGKTSLMEAMLAFVPPEDQVKYSAMTGQIAVLHGRDRPEAQDSGNRRRGGCGAGQLRPETAAKRRGVDHRQHRQGSQHGPAGDAGIPGRGTGDDLPHHDGHQDRRGVAEPLPRAVGG